MAWGLSFLGGRGEGDFRVQSSFFFFFGGGGGGWAGGVVEGGGKSRIQGPEYRIQGPAQLLGYATSNR